MFNPEYVKGYREALENLLLKLDDWEYERNRLVDNNVREWIGEKFEMLGKRKEG